LCGVTHYFTAPDRVLDISDMLDISDSWSGCLDCDTHQSQ